MLFRRSKECSSEGSHSDVDEGREKAPVNFGQEARDLSVGDDHGVGGLEIEVEFYYSR